MVAPRRLRSEGERKHAMGQTRARLRELPSSIQGEGGSGAYFAAACEAVRGTHCRDDARELLVEFGKACSVPPWVDVREIDHKLDDAEKAVRREFSCLDPYGTGLAEASPVVPYRGCAFREQLASVALRFSEEELTTPPPPAPFLIEGLVPARAVSVFGGRGGMGKSSLAVWQAICRALGMDFFGRKVKPGKTIILSTEDSRDDYRRKIAAWTQAYQLTPEQLRAVREDVLVISALGLDVDFVEAPGGRFIPSPKVYDVVEVIRGTALGADLVIAETVSRLASGEETNGSLSALVKAGEILVREAGVAVQFVAHLGKVAVKTGDSDSMAIRGGSSLGENARAVLLLQTPDAGRAARLSGMSFAKGDVRLNDLAVLGAPKVNGAPRTATRDILLERVPTQHALAFRQYAAGVSAQASSAAVTNLRDSLVSQAILDVLVELSRPNETGVAPRLTSADLKKNLFRVRQRLEVHGLELSERGVDGAVAVALDLGFVRHGSVPGRGRHIIPGVAPSAGHAGSEPRLLRAA